VNPLSGKLAQGKRQELVLDHKRGQTVGARTRLGTLIVAGSWVVLSRLVVPLPPLTDCPTWGSAGVVITVQAALALIALTAAFVVCRRESNSVVPVLGWLVGEAVIFGILAAWEYWEYGGSCHLSF
jgi:hypothetical protein